MPHPDINFSIFKDVLKSAQYSDKVEISQKRINLLNSYKSAKFEQLVDNYERLVYSHWLYFIPLYTDKFVFLQSTEAIFDKLLQTIDKSIESCSAAQTEPLTKTFQKNFTNDRIDGGGGGGRRLSMSTSTQSAGLSTSTPDWHVYDNPLLSLSNFNKINPRGPPLFALRFPDLFVY